MKLKILNQKGEEKGSLNVPNQFSEPVRRDLIKRAVIALQMNNRQAYGAKPDAGKNYSAFLSKRRRKYRGTYGIGQSRTPRKILSRNGTRIYYVGALAPQTVGGRRAHPPKAEKIWTRKINVNENRKAIRSALSATLNKELVIERGHRVPTNYPFVLSTEFNNITKTSDLLKTLETLGFSEELERTKEKKVRAGKGKTRGRKYKRKTGILIVIDKPTELALAATNIPGIDVALVTSLNAYLLAPGTQPGRLTLFTEEAFKKFEEEKLFENKVNK